MVSREPPELVVLRRGLGQQLAAGRHAVEIGQQQLAHKTGYSRSSIAHAEAGRQLLTHAFWTTADELVKADGALLAGYERVHAALQDHEQWTRETELAEAYAAARAQRATTTRYPNPVQQGSGLAVPTGQDASVSAVPAVGAALVEGAAGQLVCLAFLSGSAPAVSVDRGGRPPHEQLAQFLPGGADTVKRRELLQLLGWTAVTGAAAPVVSGLNTDEQERVARAIAAPSRVDDQVIEHLETVHRYCQQQDDVLGPRAVLTMVLAQFNVVRGLLPECPAALRPRLLSVCSRISSSAGCYFQDLNDDDHAEYYYEQARAIAHDAHDVELAVYALCLRSRVAFLQDEAHTCIDFAAAAASPATTVDDSLLRAFAGQVAAEAYAIDGQYAACMTEVERAQASQASLSASARADPRESPAYYYRDGSYLLRGKSGCLLRLGKPQEAVASAAASLALCDNSHVDHLAYSTLSLSKAYLQSVEIDKAAQVVGDAARLAAQNRSEGLVREVQATRARMQPWQGTQAVTVLDEQLGEYGLRLDAAELRTSGPTSSPRWRLDGAMITPQSSI